MKWNRNHSNRTHWFTSTLAHKETKGWNCGKIKPVIAPIEPARGSYLKVVVPSSRRSCESPLTLFQILTFIAEYASPFKICTPVCSSNFLFTILLQKYLVSTLLSYSHEMAERILAHTWTKDLVQGSWNLLLMGRKLTVKYYFYKHFRYHFHVFELITWDVIKAFCRMTYSARFTSSKFYNF